MSASPETRADDRRKNRIAFAALALGVAMLALSFASVPLYRLFCAATGYGGTTQVAARGPAQAGARDIIVRLDGNVAPGLDWAFEPETPQIVARTGRTATVFFKVRNRSDRATSAVASYNVGPDSAGAYFNKISCFCFNEMTLASHETAELPVVFFLDPALEADKTMAGVETVVLSYTFFAAKPNGRVAREARPAQDRL